MSGDPAKDTFRRGLIAGVLRGDQRFISFIDEGSERKYIAKIIEWNGDHIILQVYNGDTDLLSLKHRTLSFGGRQMLPLWESSKVSQTAKDYFLRNGNAQDDDINRILRSNNTPLNTSDDEYHFLSQTSPEIKGEAEHPHFDMISFDNVVDWTDPSLQRWMKRATDIIKEKIGITPGPQDLSADQRSQIYHVWLNDIVPLIEDPNRNQYGHSRGLTYNVNYYRNNPGVYLPHLGHILDIKSAVCKELSEFGSILFSEYGLHTKLMGITPPTKEIGHAWIKIHGDGFVEFINSNGRAKIAHTDLNFLKEPYPNLTDEKISSLIEEVNLVTPPSK